MINIVGLMNFSIYLIMSLAGYFATFNNTPSLVLERLNIFTGIGQTNLMFIGTVFTVFIFLCAYPLAYIPLRGIVLFKIRIYNNLY